MCVCVSLCVCVLSARVIASPPPNHNGLRALRSLYVTVAGLSLPDSDADDDANANANASADDNDNNNAVLDSKR